MPLLLVPEPKTRTTSGSSSRENAFEARENRVKGVSAGIVEETAAITYTVSQ